ncbi:hypothetical protein HG619_19390 [Pseudomonas syringae]|uniref:JAB domain-containing protein n=1 Tax=Pseudomonas sp. 32A TaxID=651185 RepID=UPI0040453417|nr:hypothetical protein [Pseudomonas syringae]
MRSGIQPSTFDRVLTPQLNQALVVVDVRELDHGIVAGGGMASFAEGLFQSKGSCPFSPCLD